MSYKLNKYKNISILFGTIHWPYKNSYVKSPMSLIYNNYDDFYMVIFSPL